MVGLGLRAWAVTLVSQMVAESVTITVIAPENNNFRCANSNNKSTTCTAFQTTGIVNLQSSLATGRRYPGLVTPRKTGRGAFESSELQSFLEQLAKLRRRSGSSQRIRRFV